MSTTIAELIATLGIDKSAFDKGIDDAEKRGNTFGDSLNQLGVIGGGILTAGFAAAAGGAALLGIELYKDVQAAAEAEKIGSQLNAVIKSTGGIAGITADEANNLATSLSQVTAFEDDAIVSGESMLLTFTNIGEDVFPLATETMLDLSQAMGQDLKSSAIQLGKAINDPINGMTALTRVGVTFTDEQKKQVETLQKSGDMMGAQMIILQELQKEFGGSAKAAGTTFAGKLEILKNSIGNLRESIGAKLLPILAQFISFLVDKFNQPQVQKFINDFANGIAFMAQQAVNYLPILFTNIQMAFGWLIDHQGVIVSAVAVMGAAIIAFVVSVASAMLAAAPAFLPLLAVILLIAGAAYLLYQAWTNNWGGIQQKTQAVLAFIMPLIQQLITWVQTNIPVAIQYLSSLWSNTLLPAIQSVWKWVQSVLFPFFKALIDVFVNIGRQIGVLADILATRFGPTFKAIGSWMQSTLFPILVKVGEYLFTNWVNGFKAISAGIQVVTGLLQKFSSMLQSVKPPSWLMPGSPTPFELGLLGIADAMNKVNGIGLNSLAMSGAAVGSGSASAVGGNVFNINIPAGSVMDEKELARKIVGGVEVILREKGLS